MPSELAAATEQLVEAVLNHSATNSDENVSLARGGAAYDQLRGALDQYAEAVAGNSGWGLPFEVIPDADESEWAQAGDSDVIRLVAEYSLRVHDEDLARKYLLQRHGPTVAGGASLDSYDAADIARVFYEEDGWHPENYDERILELAAPWTLKVGWGELDGQHEES